MDIRRSQGSPGGAGIATATAGLLPAFILIFGGSALFAMIMESLIPGSRPRSEVWALVGAGGGLWISFLMIKSARPFATSAPLRALVAVMLFILS